MGEKSKKNKKSKPENKPDETKAEGLRNRKNKGSPVKSASSEIDKKTVVTEDVKDEEPEIGTDTEEKLPETPLKRKNSQSESCCNESDSGVDHSDTECDKLLKQTDIHRDSCSGSISRWKHVPCIEDMDPTYVLYHYISLSVVTILTVATRLYQITEPRHVW